MLQDIDFAVSTALNQYSHASAVFDEAMVVIAHNHLLKGGVLLALLWWAWMRRGNGLITRDLFFVRTVAGALVAVALARALQNLLPHRTRPMLDPALDFLPPVGVDPVALDGWSSFPSDHAVLFFALSTALWHASRPAGLFAYAWTTVVICLPRIYLGYHYPTDILAGAVVGAAVMMAALYVPLPSAAWRPLEALQRRQAGWLHAIAFLITLQMATLFENARRLLGGAAKVLLGQ